MNFLSLFIFTLLFNSVAISQGNLQFNQVVSYSGTSSSNNSPTWTVPIGKVWKIETASASYGLTAFRRVYVDAGGGFGNFSISNVNETTAPQVFPIWLKSGDQVYVFASCSSCGVQVLNYVISIIEFNIIP
jgi:hypothetical protein